VPASATALTGALAGASFVLLPPFATRKSTTSTSTEATINPMMTISHTMADLFCAGVSGAACGYVAWG